MPQKNSHLSSLGIQIREKTGLSTRRVVIRVRLVVYRARRVDFSDRLNVNSPRRRRVRLVVIRLVVTATPPPSMCLDPWWY